MCLGIPGQIVRIDDADNAVATVDVCGVRRRVDISCIIDASHCARDCVGDWVLVHVGFAMSRIDAAHAQETLRILEELSELSGELDAIQSSAQPLPAQRCQSGSEA
jgi:hydrogenase expression/formation protein HypC